MTQAQNTTAYIQGFEDGERFTKAKILQEMESDKREWVGLTDTQIERVYFEVTKEHRGAPMPWGQVRFGRALLEKFKEVNT
jgi:hypothetical protein